MDIQYKYATVKFNGGSGALLCSKCRIIIATGFEHEDVQHFCVNCTPKHRYVDPLVDRDCAQLDGWCKCKTKDDCKYNKPSV